MEVVSFSEETGVVSIQLERIAGNEFQITDSSVEQWDVLGYYPYPQNDVLTWGEAAFELSTPMMPMP